MTGPERLRAMAASTRASTDVARRAGDHGSAEAMADYAAMLDRAADALELVESAQGAEAFATRTFSAGGEWHVRADEMIGCSAPALTDARTELRRRLVATVLALGEKDSP